MCRSNQRSYGFSLVEVMVAMAVIGIAVLSLYTAFASGFSSIRRSRENVRATQILVQKLESIRLYTWEQLNDRAFLPSTFTESYPANSTLVRYEGTVLITNLPTGTSYSDDLKQITIRLQWRGVNAMEQRREMTTLVARHGLQGYVP